MSRLKNASKILSRGDKISIGLIIAFVVIITALMRLDTASWAFRHSNHFIAVNETLPQPKLDFSVTDLGHGDLQIHLELENISLVETCTPKDIGLAKGHAHISVDGIKYGSFFITEAAIAKIPPGPHRITVSLNKPPSHKVLTWKGDPIAVSKTINVKKYRKNR